MLGLEFCQVIDIFIHNDPQVIRLLVGGDIAGGEGLGHNGSHGQ